MLNSRTVGIGVTEMSSEFYPQVTAQTSISPNLIPIDNYFPFVNLTTPAPFANAQIKTLTEPTLLTPPSNTNPIKSPTALSTTANNAITQVVSAVGTATGTVLGNLLNNAVASVGNGIQGTIAPAGATLMTASIKEWFKRNWYYVASVLVLFFTAVWYFGFYKNKKQPYKRK